MGHTVVQVLMTNRGAATCLLDGYPSVAGVATDGSLTVLDAAHDNYTGDPGLPGVIAPGETTAVKLEGAWACEQALNGGSHPWNTIQFGLPAGGTVRVDVEFDSTCGVSVSRFGLPSKQPAVPATPPPSPLLAAIASPSTTHPGDVLTYTVTLTNPTETIYRFESCPVYEEYLTTFTGENGDNTFATLKDYMLNCRATPTIGAHSAVTFQMELTVPSNQPAGNAKFGWEVLGGSGPWTYAPMTVLAP